MNKIWALIAGIGVFIGMMFKNRALKAEKEQAEDRADIAEASRDNLQGINESLNELEQQHQQEDADAEKDRIADQRDGMDNNW